MSLCPCCSGLEVEKCCEPIILGTSFANTPETLMRARYSAHVLGKFSFLSTSLHNSVQDASSEKELEEANPIIDWICLEIVSTEGGTVDDQFGKVNFIARYRVKDITQEHKETAKFIKENDQWYYLDGDVEGHITYKRENPKIGRNDECPCGSGKKHKKCCMKD